MQIFSFFSFQFFFFWIVFAIAIFFSWGLPGLVVLRRCKIGFLKDFNKNFLPKILISLAVGMILWAVQGAIFGLLGVRWLSYGYLLVFAGEFVVHFKKYKSLIDGMKKWLRLSKMVWIFLVVGSVLQLVGIFPSGFLEKNGLSFYQNHAGDSVMHVSFMNEMVRQFPPEQPGATGYLITNYHYWSDLVMAELSRVWGIPMIHLFFQYITVFMALGTGLAVVAVVKAWGGGIKTQLLALFFHYLGGDASFLLTAIIHRRLYFISSAIDNGAEQLFNMPHTFAKFLFVVSILPMTYWLQKELPEKERKKWAIVFGFIVAFLVGFKVYYGMFIALGLGVLVLYEIWKGKRLSWIFSLQVLAGVGFVSALIFFPVNKSAGGLYYAPFEWPRLMLEKQNLDYQDWFLRMQVYKEHNNQRNIFILNIVAVIFAFICIHGTRVLGFVFTRDLKKTLGARGYASVIIPMLLFTFLGFTTLQVSGNFNVYNFFVVSLVVLNISSAFLMTQWLGSSKRWLWFLAVTILALTPARSLVSVLESLRNYDKEAKYFISSTEYQALVDLREIFSNEKILQPHPNNELSYHDAYIALFTNVRQFATAEKNLLVHNQPVEELLLKRDAMFEASSSGQLADNLHRNKIDYFYLQKNDPSQKFSFSLEDGFHLIYENEAVLVYDVVR